jgi:ABC-type multidrug transport system, ATPase component
MELIEIKNLSHSFGSHVVLKDLNLTVRDNEILGLIGVNGSGKSTFLRLISGVMTPDCGEVLYDGQSVGKGATRRKLFLLSDDPFFAEGTTADDLYALYKTFYPEIRRDVYDQLMALSALPHKKSLSKFSKGMRRQTFIALAFAIAPKFILLDEAFDGLDPIARARFKEYVRNAANNGSTIIISSHALRELEGFCDNYLILSDTRFASPEMVENKVNSFVKYQLAFEQTPTKEMFARLNLHKCEIVGRIATIIAEGSEDKIIMEIDALRPLMVDRLEIEPGEILLDTMKELVGGGVEL